MENPKKEVLSYEKPVLLLEVIENPGSKTKPYLLKLNPEGLKAISLTKEELVRNKIQK